MKSKEDIYQFLNSRPLAVISTTHPDGSPQAAVVGFGQTAKLQLLFATDNSSRKYKNIVNNPRVAFAIGWENSETIQFEGIARELSESELDIVRNNYWKKNPKAEAHHKKPGQRYFIVEPVWIRYTNLGVNPWNVTEIKF